MVVEEAAVTNSSPGEIDESTAEEATGRVDGAFKSKHISYILTYIHNLSESRSCTSPVQSQRLAPCAIGQALYLMYLMIAVTENCAFAHEVRSFSLLVGG